MLVDHDGHVFFYIRGGENKSCIKYMSFLPALLPKNNLLSFLKIIFMTYEINYYYHIFICEKKHI